MACRNHISATSGECMSVLRHVMDYLWTPTPTKQCLLLFCVQCIPPTLSSSLVPLLLCSHPRTNNKLRLHPSNRSQRRSASLASSSSSSQNNSNDTSNNGIISGIPNNSTNSAPLTRVEEEDEEEEEEDKDDDPEIALIFAACAVGVATGASVVVFNDAIHFIRDNIWHGETLLTGRQLLQQFSELELWPRIVFPPVLGGIFVGVLGLFAGGYVDPPLNFLDPRNLSTTNNNKSSKSSKSIHRHMELMITRPLARAVAAAVTLGTGASLGPEGPSVDIGRSWSKGMLMLLKDPQKHMTSLIAAGSGAGVAAGFNAPIAGVFFAVETVLQRQLLRNVASGAKQAQQQAQRMEDSSALTVAMVLLASVLAAVVSQAGLGSSPAFRVPEYRLQSMYELPLYFVFGALCGAISSSFSYSARVAEDAFNELRQSQDSNDFTLSGLASLALLPALGGLTTGVLALGYPEILYQGFDNVSSVLSSNGDYPPGLLIQIVVLKIIATTISRGSGLQGGLYAPSIFIGAALGSAFGLCVHAIGDPSGVMLSAPQAYALVGVAAMLASNCGVPLTAVLLLFELTRDYLIIVPTLAAVGISFWISSLAAPGVQNAAARRQDQRRRRALLATATKSFEMSGGGASGISTNSSGTDSTVGSALASVDGEARGLLLEQIKERLRDGALLQETAVEAPPLVVVDPPNRASPSGSRSLGSAVGSGTASGTALSADGQMSLDEETQRALMMACVSAEKGCLLLTDDMSLAAALALMEAEDQGSAVVIGGERGAVLGVLSREANKMKQDVEL